MYFYQLTLNVLSTKKQHALKLISQKYYYYIIVILLLLLSRLDHKEWIRPGIHATQSTLAY